MSRTAIEQLLHAGYGDRTIARRLGVTIGTVRRTRTDLGLPPARGGNKPAQTVEDLFWRRTKPVDGGHLEWTGHRTNRGTGATKWQGAVYTAGRIAYRIHNGTDPIGRTHATCDYDGCVAPAHTGDTAVTPRRAHHHHGGAKPNGSREQIVDLLRAGHSDQYIRRLLHTDDKRVSRIRREEGIPRTPRTGPPFAEKWAASTEPTADGHLAWTGRRRDGVTPSLVYRGREYSARRAAFIEHHGRDPQGNVLAGCGWEPCVHPDHLEDQAMRRADQLYTAIFGTAA